jgi:flagellar motility protein MotE (MotC chaperone)
MRIIPLHSVGFAGIAGLMALLAPAQPANAQNRSWTATVVTGSIGPQSAEAPKSAPARQKSNRDRDQVVTAPSSETKSVETSAPARSVPERTRASIASIPEGKLAQQYCINIASAAADARVVWQKKTLADIEQELEKRIAKLEEKAAEYQKWLAKRDEYSKRAQEQLVGIFARMRADAAAAQLAAADEETAAAVLSKLDVRVSSAILAEMEPNQAARLTAIMVGASRIPPDRSTKSAAADGRRS